MQNKLQTSFALFTSSIILSVIFVPSFAQTDSRKTNNKIIDIELLSGESPAIQFNPSHREVLTGEKSLEEFISEGRALFATQFNVLDGSGRPMSTGDSKPTIRMRKGKPGFQRLAGPDANSCAGCHNQPDQGGAGDFVANVFVGAHFTDPPTTKLSPEITNERNTIDIFGSGAIEMLAFEMSQDLHAIRDQATFEASNQGSNYRAELKSKGVSFGFITMRPDGTYDSSEFSGVDLDLVIKPFGAKGVAISLREFTNFALNQHHGIQTDERFGWERTGVEDFDGDGVVHELTTGQVSALSLYQASLPSPKRITTNDLELNETIKKGEYLFQNIGCSNCHIPKLPLRTSFFFEPNPLNRPGSAKPDDLGGQIMMPLNISTGSGVYKGEDNQVYVAAFSDFKRHVICDDRDMHFCNEEVIQDFVPTNQFLTSRLWGVGSTAPYGHRGDLTTLSEAILHHSGEAFQAAQNFKDLADEDKKAIITFLKSLKIVPESVNENKGEKNEHS